MNIAFRIDGGADIGMGHIIRMSALSDAFNDLGGNSSFFYSKHEPIDYSDFDLVVLDSYLLSDEYIEQTNAPRRFLLCYDDNSLYQYSCDAVINANLHAAELVFRFGKKQPKLLLGGEYALLRREFWNSEPIRIRERARRVFICFGGADVRKITPDIVRQIQDIPDVEIVAVVGRLSDCAGAIKAIAKNNVEIVVDPHSISSVMGACDIAVVSPSSMVYEIAALGIPSLTITQADNQEIIASYLSNHGLMKNIGDWDNYSTILLINEVKSLLSDVCRRRKESLRLLGAVNSKGSVNTAKEIVRLMNEVTG